MTIEIDLLDTESANEAIFVVSELAAANNVVWSLVGGIAAALYGVTEIQKMSMRSPTSYCR